MRSWKHLLAVPAAGALVAGLLVAGASPAAWSKPAAPTAATGQGRAVARSVNLATAAKGAQIAPQARSFGPLGRDGHPTGTSLSATSTVAVKPRCHHTGQRSERPDHRLPAVDNQPTGRAGDNQRELRRDHPGRRQLRRLPTPRPERRGQPHPDRARGEPSAAGVQQDRRNLVRDRVEHSARLHRADLRPPLQWDNLNNRFTMAVIPVPATTTATPRMFLSTSQTSGACGSWWMYNLASADPSTRPAPFWITRTWDRTGVALLSSSNNFRRTAAGGFTYINSAVFSIYKAAVYAGAAVNFPAFAVGFSTAPVTVTGIPIAATAFAYYLRSIPGTGYQLYRMANSGIAGTTLTPQAAASSPFVAPPRRVRQPGTTVALDPLDGRIQSTPFQDEGFVWFAHGQGVFRIPRRRYGAITPPNTVTAQNAFRSSTSDDFNPSVGVADAGAGIIYLWLNWAYTDTPNNRATSHTVDWVTPGSGVPALIGTGRVLINGFSTTTNTRFGDFSSVAIDPAAASATCPAGRTAVVAQQVFQSNGQWITRIARVSFC